MSVRTADGTTQRYTADLLDVDKSHALLGQVCLKDVFRGFIVTVTQRNIVLLWTHTYTYTHTIHVTINYVSARSGTNRDVDVGQNVACGGVAVKLVPLLQYMQID